MPRRLSRSLDSLKDLLPDLLAFSPRHLLGKLPMGRHAIYALARKIGVRQGRRWIIPRAALLAWLRGGAK